MQEGCELPLGLGGGHDPSKERLDKQGMLGDGIGEITLSLAIPARNKGEAVSDIFDFDVHRSGIKQIKPAA